MKKKVSVHPVAVALFVLFLVAAMPWLFPLKNGSDQPRDPASEDQAVPAVLDENQNESATSHENPSVSHLNLGEWMRLQAGKIGQPDESPERTMASLKTKAEGLALQDIKDLERWALETERNGDERFLAVELLIMNPRLESAESLGRILMTPEPSRAAEPVLENILRARAVEGLGSHPRREAARILRDSLYRVSDRSLIDRGERALVARKNASISPMEQDRKALHSILKKIR